MIFDRIDNIEQRMKISDLNNFTWDDVIGEGFNIGDMTEQTYFNSLTILSNSIAKLPIILKQNTENGEIEAKDNELFDILKLRMNENMNTFEVMKAFILRFKHYGISGLFINRNSKGKITGLFPVKINKITIDNVGLIKSKKNNKVIIDFQCCGKNDTCFDKDIIILKDNSFDGIHFKPTKDYIKNTIDTNLQAQKLQKDMFSNGLTNKAAVQMVSDIKDQKELNKIQEKFDRLYKSSQRLFFLPAGYQISPLNLDLASSQFAELKTMGKNDICNALGVPVALLDKGFLTEEETISYLTNTLFPIIVQIEQEMNYKLLTQLNRKNGFKIRFNVNAMLRTSAETQKNIIVDYVKNGVYSLEYARKLLGVHSDFENEVVSLPSGQILLSDLINGNATWQTQNNKVINEVMEKLNNLIDNNGGEKDGK